MLTPDLINLWDIMKRVRASLFVDHGRMTGMAEGSALHHPTEQLGEAMRPNMRGLAEDLLAECEAIGLRASMMSARRLLEACDSPLTMGQLSKIYGELTERMSDEMTATVLLALDPEQVKNFTEANPFGSIVSARFSSAIVDIEEAGKCLALDRGTACVFHLMRVLEIGLQELATKLGVSLAKDRNWQPILNDVQRAVGALPRGTAEEKAYLAQCSEAALQLQHVKDAWRNDVMHPRDTYTVEQARDVFDCSRRLMVTLVGLV